MVSRKDIRMRKFHCTVSLEYDYIIEIDEEKFANLDDDAEEGIGGKAWRKHFFDFHSWEDHAEYIAIRKALGDEFIEGYGVPLVNGRDPRWCKDNSAPQDAINIEVVLEDYCYADVAEIIE